VDGHPASLSAAGPVLTLDGGRVIELSVNEYQVIWDTGEIMDVFNAGSHLNVTFPGSPQGGPASVEGLLGTDIAWSSEFLLVGGRRVLIDDLSGVLADAWRVPEAASLFDPSASVPEPTSFTLLGLGIGLTAIIMMRRRPTSLKPR
jgi:hypothetical protein